MSNIRLFEPTFINPFESMFKSIMSPNWFDFDMSPDRLDMRLDVSEKNGHYTVRADLPGVKKEDINVRVNGCNVQIDAEAQNESETKENGNKLIKKERHYGAVSRSFNLMEEIDDTKVEAKYEDGVLTLTLPKKAESNAKQIPIH